MGFNSAMFVGQTGGPFTTTTTVKLAFLCRLGKRRTEMHKIEKMPVAAVSKEGVVFGMYCCLFSSRFPLLS